MWCVSVSVRLSRLLSRLVLTVFVLPLMAGALKPAVGSNTVSPPTYVVPCLLPVHGFEGIEHSPDN